ncbi:MAG: amidohydrolase family protein [Deltaproteobacteria bacterium]|nr:amidohydrolase family protein [Deltaproteobacteria bacterium]
MNKKQNEKMVLPLPVDTHVHLSLGGSPEDNARRQLAAGIAVVRDAGDRDGLLESAFLPEALRVIRTGPALFKKGMYGAFLGENRNFTLAEKIARTPSAFVKVILTGMVSFDEYGRVGPQQWSFGELCEIVRLAAAIGKKVMVHVNSANACREAVAAGVHSLEHAYFIAPETLKIMAEKGVFWAPTVAAMANQLKDPDRRFSQTQLGIIERNYKRHLEMIGLAFAEGVKLTIGTDSGSYNVPHGSSFLREMELFAAAGIPVAEIFQIATRNGRQLLELSEPNPAASLSLEPDAPLTELLNRSRSLLQGLYPDVFADESRA